VARPGIINFLFYGVRGALGLSPPGRSLHIFSDDVFLVSFPKSGNTWTRFLVGNLISTAQPATFSNIHILVPDPTGTSRRDFNRIPRPRVIKSHECFNPRYPRVIYIVRDPRDVVVSQYHYYRKIREIADELPLETFVGRFLAGETWPYAWGHHLVSWEQHVLTWLGTREGNPRFLMLRYEDMLADTCCELRKLAAFIGLDITNAQLAQAVERSSAGKMRQIEQAQGADLDRMMGANSRKDLMFVRAAVSGGWRKDLPMPMVETIEAAWGPMMRHLGYGLTTQAPTKACDHGTITLDFGSRVGRTLLTN